MKMAPSSYSCSLVPRYAVPRSPHLTGSSSNEDGARRQREHQKSLRLDWQNKNFFVNFFAVDARLRRETGTVDIYIKKRYRVSHYVRRLNCRQIIRLNLKMEGF